MATRELSPNPTAMPAPVSLRLALFGDVELSDMVGAFGCLVSALHAVEAALQGEDATERVRWMVSGLEHGSCVLTLAPAVDSATAAIVKTQSTEAFSAAVAGDFRRVPKAARHSLRQLVRVGRRGAGLELDPCDGRPTVRVEAAARGTKRHRSSNEVAVDDERAIGSLIGTVQSISWTSRRSLATFVIEESNGNRVKAHLTETEDEALLQVLASAWRRVAVVHGEVVRDGTSGVPREIRRVRRLHLARGESGGAWRAALGVLQPEVTSEQTAAALRRLRDDE